MRVPGRRFLMLIIVSNSTRLRACTGIENRSFVPTDEQCCWIRLILQVIAESACGLSHAGSPTSFPGGNACTISICALFWPAQLTMSYRQSPVSVLPLHNIKNKQKPKQSKAKQTKTKRKQNIERSI